MLKKKQNPEVLKVIKKLQDIFSKIDCTETNIGGRNFLILRKYCSLWNWDKNYVSICISGGKNSGVGLWSNYLKSLSEAMKLIEDTWEDSFIEKIDNDTADDIFYATIIIKVR